MARGGRRLLVARIFTQVAQEELQRFMRRDRAKEVPLGVSNPGH